MGTKTAVEWLLWQIEEKNGKDFPSYYTEFIEQAKELEKKQMKKFVEHLFVIGDNSKAFFDKEFEQFYNQTYGGDNG